MAYKVEIRGEGAQITLVLGEESHGIESLAGYEDDLVPCRISLKVDPWIGYLRTTFELRKIEAFSRHLDLAVAALSGEAELISLEDDFGLIIILDKGKAKVKGNAGSIAQCITEFSFEFASDQSYLTPLSRQLSALILSGRERLD